MMIFLQILFGILGGFFGGLGMGGGTILIPILTIFLGFDQQLSQGINLLSFLVMAIISICIHLHNNLIETKGVFWIIIGGLISAVGGSFLATVLPSYILRKCFGVFLIIIAIYQIYSLFKMYIKEKNRNNTNK